MSMSMSDTEKTWEILDYERVLMDVLWQDLERPREARFTTFEAFRAAFSASLATLFSEGVVEQALEALDGGHLEFPAGNLGFPTPTYRGP